MSAIRETGDYEQWIKFFLEGIYASGESAIETANELILLRDKNMKKIEGEKYTKRTLETMMKVFHYLEAHPIIEIGKTAEDLSIAYNTVSSAVDRFGKLGILYLVKEQGRNKVYSYKEYIDILRNGTEVLV